MNRLGTLLVACATVAVLQLPSHVQSAEASVVATPANLASHASVVGLSIKKVTYVYGSTNVQLNATIRSTSGTLVFKVGAKSLCSAPVRSGNVSCRAATTALNAGSYPLVAHYSGNASAPASTSSSTLTVLPSPVRITLVPSTSTVSSSAISSVSLTCTLRTTSGLKVPGSVSMSLDGHLLGQPVTCAKVFTLSRFTTSIGHHTLSASYGGSRNFKSAVARVALTVTDTVIAVGLTPTFGSVTPTTTGFVTQISNFNPAYSWSGSATAGGTVSIDNIGTVIVSGLAPSMESTVTVTSVGPGSTSASATLSGQSIAGPDQAMLTSITGIDGSKIDDTANGASFLNQYYSLADHWFESYVDAGTSVILNWHVTNANGVTLANEPVTLVDNLIDSTSNGTRWSLVALDAANGSISGMTNSNGDVSFTLQNTNSTSGTRPSNTTTAAAAETNEGLYPWTRVGLKVGSDSFAINSNPSVNQSTDLIDLIVIPPTNTTTTTTPATTNYDQNPGTLLWQESFTGTAGTAPDNTLWTPEEGQYTGRATGLPNWNYGTGEIETNTANATNVSADGSGNLAITARCTSSTSNCSAWTSARISTAGKKYFQYGQLEARIKMPAGSYNWPAFWMLGKNFFPNQSWPSCGEIDLMEGLANNSVDQATLHANNPDGSDWNGGGGVTLVAPLSAPFSAGYHNFGMLWSPNEIQFLLDGVVWGKDVYNPTTFMVTQTSGSYTNTYSIGANLWPFNAPFFIILQDAIPSNASAPNGSTATMDVSWIKYYTYNGYGQTS